MPADKRVERGLPPPHFAYLRYERFLTTYQPPGWLRQSVLSFEDKKLGRGCFSSISQIVTDIYSSNSWDAVSIFLSLVSTRKVPKYKMYLESFYRRCYLSSSHIAFFKKFWTFFILLFMKWSEVKSFSHVRLFVTPWTIAYQAHTSMGFPRQEYWSRLPFPFPGDLRNPGIEPRSPALQALTSEPPCIEQKERATFSTENQKHSEKLLQSIFLGSRPLAKKIEGLCWSSSG